MLPLERIKALYELKRANLELELILTQRAHAEEVARLSLSYSERPDHDSYFISMAFLIATRATCSRRRVGCVLVNKRNHVLATGYNGNSAGQPHCVSHPCPGANGSPGRDLDKCEATHAEQNALLQCKDVYQIETCYTTCSPCITCTKLLLNTSCQRIVFFEEYPHPEAGKLWVASNNREWRKYASPTTALVQALQHMDGAKRVS